MKGGEPAAAESMMPASVEGLLSGAGLVALSIVEIAAIVVFLYLVQRFFEARYKDDPSFQFRKQLILLALTFTAVILTIVILPLGATLRGQLLSLLGILLSAAIALSSTTFIGNAMAGIMLKALKNCRRGDFVKVGDHFGRITELDLLHTEIQTEERDLTTLPNLYLVTNPMRVMRASGTIVSVSLSLGYDVSRRQIEPLLIEAAEAAELSEPFVEITNLGDFSVVYKVAGLLTDVQRLIAVRSRLRAKVLDVLHGAGIEIVSPNFMNTRAVADGRLFVPAQSRAEAEPEPDKSPDAIVFDKAAEAAQVEATGDQLTALQADIAAGRDKLKTLTEGTAGFERMTNQLAQWEKSAERVARILKKKEGKLQESE